MTILIVDDNAGLRRLIRHVLTGLDAQVFECFDGSDALAAYAIYRPSVVLMDICMPRLDGLTATRQITQAYPVARVIIVTECDDDSIRQSSREAGACGYILKQNLPDLGRLIRLLIVDLPEAK
jgi:CheY-like chemotaxis protein